MAIVGQKTAARAVQPATGKLGVLSVGLGAVATTFIAGVELKDNYEALPRIRTWVQKEPEVQQLFYVTGAVDLVMVILSKSVKEYDALSARLMAEVPQVIRMTTNVVIDAMKSDLYVPVDE